MCTCVFQASVRVLIQNSTGQVVEDELMSGCGLSTINKSVAMEMTSVDNISSSDTFTITEHHKQVQYINV